MARAIGDEEARGDTLERSKIKVDVKFTGINERFSLGKRAKTDEPEPTPVEEPEDGPDECPCGQCGKGAEATSVPSS
jgi:hypothetical protein